MFNLVEILGIGVFSLTSVVIAIELLIAANRNRKRFPKW
jgi:hypothetical protein